MPVQGGSVYVDTAAGHRLKGAGKGKPRQFICERCDDHLFIDLALDHAAAGVELARLAVEHGGAICPSKARKAKS